MFKRTMLNDSLARASLNHFNFPHSIHRNINNCWQCNTYTWKSRHTCTQQTLLQVHMAQWKTPTFVYFMQSLSNTQGIRNGINISVQLSHALFPRCTQAIVRRINLSDQKCWHQYFDAYISDQRAVKCFPICDFSVRADCENLRLIGTVLDLTQQPNTRQQKYSGQIHWG